MGAVLINADGRTGQSYSAVHGFWPVEFSNGRLGASHNAATAS